MNLQVRYGETMQSPLRAAATCAILALFSLATAITGHSQSNLALNQAATASTYCNGCGAISERPEVGHRLDQRPRRHSRRSIFRTIKQACKTNSIEDEELVLTPGDQMVRSNSRSNRGRF